MSSVGSFLAPPPLRIVFHPNLTHQHLISQSKIKNRGFRDAWAQTTRPRALFEPEWYDCPQTKNRVNQLGSRNFKGWNIKFQDTTFNYTPLKTNICPEHWWLEDHFFPLKRLVSPFWENMFVFGLGANREHGGCDLNPINFRPTPKTSTQRLRRILPGRDFKGGFLAAPHLGTPSRLFVLEDRVSAGRAVDVG